MTTEEQQERSALYALGLLDADEAAAFEREMTADGELRTLTTELHEAAASLARTDTSGSPSAALKVRVLACVAAENDRHYPVAGKVIAGPSAWSRRIPWSLAAAFAILCAVLGWRSHALDLDAKMARYAAASPEEGALQQVAFCRLEAIPNAQQTGPQAAVLWDATQRRGRLRITNLPPAAAGKDYQLWTVEAGRKDPVSAGVVKVGANKAAEIEFRPESDEGKAEVVAFALSVERAGGVPKNEGPIIYLGKL